MGDVKVEALPPGQFIIDGKYLAKFDDCKFDRDDVALPTKAKIVSVGDWFLPQYLVRFECPTCLREFRRFYVVGEVSKEKQPEKWKKHK